MTIVQPSAIQHSTPQPPASQPTVTQTAHAAERNVEARGFAFYVGLDEFSALADGVTLAQLAERLRAIVAEVAPRAETHATLAIAPAGAGGRSVDVVRAALHDPAFAQKAQAERRAAGIVPNEGPKRRTGIVIDISRRRVLLDGETTPLTYREFELLHFPAPREGRSVDRAEIITGLWAEATGDDVPNDRTIDVHVRRLRAKLGDYQDIVRTVRGTGYRFDRHADVSIRFAATPSPDVF